MAIIPIAIKFAQTVFRYRKHIYRTLMAQDRAIDKAFRVGGYGRQTRYGARHGAGAGAIIGTFISNNGEDSPGNELQKPFQRSKPVITPRKPYKTRGRFSGRSGYRYTDKYCPPQKRR